MNIILGEGHVSEGTELTSKLIRPVCAGRNSALVVGLLLHTLTEFLLIATQTVVKADMMLFVRANIERDLNTATKQSSLKGQGAVVLR